MKWGLWHLRNKTWCTDNFVRIESDTPFTQGEIANLGWGLEEVENRRLEPSDNVSSPTHYTMFPGIEVIQLTRHLNFNRGNAIKYLARAGKKTKDGEPGPTTQGDLEDIKKALWYVADECQRLGVGVDEIARIVAAHAGHK